MATRTVAHRASFLQAFHTATSETQRLANIEANKIDTPIEVPVQADETATRKLKAGQRVGNGIVRTISEKQKGFILSLLSKKDITNLTILPGQTINPDEIGNMGVKGGTALIEKLLNCPNKPSHSVSILNQGSPKQQSFIRSLMTQLNLTESDINNRSYPSVSDAISELLKETKSMPKQTNNVSEGMYTDGVKIIRAYMNREGTRLLAKQLIKDDNDYSFEYLGMAVKFISGMRKMTLDEAKQFGVMSGTCCVCGIHLTDPDSQKKGIGPYCSQQF